MNKYYKIMDYSEKGPKSLFHANNGSKLIPMREWIEASRYELVSDGSGKYGGTNTKYMSGWHLFYTYTEAKEYLFKNFKNICNKLIVTCWAYGDLRRKEHSRGNVWLAQFLYLEDILFHQMEGYRKNS